MVSMQDVARAAGVSVATVSHAITDKRYVSPDLRARVAAAMKELDYSPSRSARNLALGRTNVLGMLVPDLANGFFAELAKGTEQAAHRSGYNVIIGNTGWDSQRELSYLEMVRSRAVDGLVYAAGSHHTGTDVLHIVGDTPLVLVDEEVDGLRACSVVSDNALGGQLAAQHLLGLGHTRALAVGAQDALASSRKRISGFARQWEKTTGSAPQIAHSDFTSEGGAALVRRYIHDIRQRSITAIFAANDLLAIGMITELVDNGISVPQDVSVVGFDDAPNAEWMRPRLTTIRQPANAMGEMAADLLLTALREKRSPEHKQEVLGVELIVRDSTQAAR